MEFIVMVTGNLKEAVNRTAMEAHTLLSLSP